MPRKSLVVLALVSLLLLALPRGARADNVLKFGSLAPSSSPWAQVLRVWQRAVNERSHGELRLQFYWNGTQGDESDMIGKVKAGQLDGAAVSAIGLGRIHKPILALMMPGLFGSWNALDKARASLRPEFQQAALRDKGLLIAGWGDVGRVHMFSRGFEVTGPSSLRGQRPLVNRDDDISRTLYQVIGGVTPVPLSVPEVLPALNAGSLSVVNAPSLVCEQMQWAGRLDHMVLDSATMVIGAMVLSDRRISQLPADQRELLTQTGEVASRELTRRIRAEDDAAFARLREKMTTRSLSDSEKAEWREVFRTVRDRLSQQGVFPPELIARIEKMGG